MVINGHLMGLAVYGPQDSPLADQQGLRLLMDLAEELRRRSPQLDAEVTSATRNGSERGIGTGVKRLLGGLFPNSG